MKHNDDAAVDGLIEAYLAHVRGEGPPPDLAGLDGVERARAQQAIDLLDALTDMGRELPAFAADPLAARLASRRPPAEHTPAVRLVPAEPVVAPVRRRRPQFGRSLWGMAAALTLVFAPTSVLVLGRDRSTASASVARVALSSVCPAHGRPVPAFAEDLPHVTVAATWAGAERDRFEKVLDRFAKEAGVNVSFATEPPDPPEADRDLGRTLEALDGTECAPDVALLPQPGLMRELVAKGRLEPLDDDTWDVVSAHYSPAWRELGTVDGTPYGVWFKAANKSIVWYNAKAFADAGVQVPRDWEGLKQAAARLRAAGIVPFAVAGERDSAWVLSDWFENVYLRTAGPEKYDELAEGRRRWTDPTVKEALSRLAEILGRSEWLAGGTAGALELSYEESVRKVFGHAGAPEAAMVFEGDFVAGLLPENVDATFFEFPSIGLHDSTVVGTGGPAAGEAGGDVAVLLKDTDAGRRLLRFLATPEAAEPWVSAGGFVSPNRSVDLGLYPHPALREAAADLVEARDLRFDLSDLVKPAFGSTPGHGMWEVLRAFLADPRDVDGTAQRLQQAWEAAR